MLEKKKLNALSENLVANPDNYIASFRKNVDMYISQKEITLAEVSEMADIPLSTLKTFLYGDAKDCHLSTAVKLAKVFNISVDELVGCGTLAPQTCESLQLTRLLPESFTHFVRWATHFHYDMLTSNKVTEKAIEVMLPEIDGETGNVRMTNDFEVVDISDINPDIRPKVFMGIKVLDNQYAPKFFENDIILLANDREARVNEFLAISVNKNMWIAKSKVDIVDGVKQVSYQSVRTGGPVFTEKDSVLVMGYIAKVHRN